jgi:hypothetical protein
MRRGYQRLRGDISVTITGIIFNLIMALVVGSVFYNLPDNTGALYSRGALLFFAILLAALASAMEVRLISSFHERTKSSRFLRCTHNARLWRSKRSMPSIIPLQKPLVSCGPGFHLHKLTHRSLDDLRPTKQD